MEGGVICNRPGREPAGNWWGASRGLVGGHLTTSHLPSSEGWFRFGFGGFSLQCRTCGLMLLKHLNYLYKNLKKCLKASIVTTLLSTGPCPMKQEVTLQDDDQP